MFGFQNNFKICVVLLYGSEILSKNFAKLWFFILKKNWDIWNPKFQQNSIVYYFAFIFLAFLAFCFLFHLSKVFQKLWNFLKCFIARVRDFTNDLWKILKVLLKKILICEIIFFQNSAVYFLFFYFFIIFDILFSVSCICTCQKIIEIFMCFCFMDERFYQRILETHGIFF